MDLYTLVLDDHKQVKMLKLVSALEDVFNSENNIAVEQFERALAKDKVYENKVVSLDGVRVV